MKQNPQDDFYYKEDYPVSDQPFLHGEHTTPWRMFYRCLMKETLEMKLEGTVRLLRLLLLEPSQDCAPG